MGGLKARREAVEGLGMFAMLFSSWRGMKGVRCFNSLPLLSPPQLEVPWQAQPL